MAQILTEVTINSVDIVNSLIDWSVTEDFGSEPGECEITCSRSIYTLIPTLASGMSITIKRGTVTTTDEWVFRGTVVGIEKKGARVKITGDDRMGDLVNASVNYSYDGIAFPSTEAKGSDIARDLIETWGGMTAVVVDTGTVLTLAKFICSGTDVYSRLRVLSDIYDYQLYYVASTDTVHFEPKGYTFNTNTLYVGGPNKNTSNVPVWKFDSDELVNELVVKGAVQEVEDTELFSGTGGAGQFFTLTKKPISVKVLEGTTLKKPGVSSSTSGAFDYTIDKENSKIVPTTNWIPASGSNNITITYTNAIPVPIRVSDPTSIALYGTRVAEKYFNDIQTVEDAERRGNGWLTRYSTPFIEVTAQMVTSRNYAVGEQVQIIDTIQSEDRILVINQIEKTYPAGGGDTLVLGDKPIRLAEFGYFTLERIRRLEEENQRNIDLVVDIKTFENTTQFVRRYLQVIKKTPTGTGFIFDHPTLGLLGTATLDDDPFGAEDIIRIVWRNQTVTEFFIDNDFKDTINTTADWNITTNVLTF